MANQSKKTEKTKKTSNNNLIIGCCVAVIVVIAIIIAVVIAVNNSGISDSYFVSDDTKYVLTIESDDIQSDSEENQYTPLKTHLVYAYEGDTVTGLKSYYEYADAASAQSAYNAMKDAMAENASDEISQMEVSGKYIVVTAKEDAYKDMTASDVKQQIEFMETLKNMNSSDAAEDTADAETVEVEENNED